MAREYEKRREAMGQKQKVTEPEVISEDVLLIDDSVTDEQIVEAVEEAIEKVTPNRKRRSRKKSEEDSK